MSEFKTTDPIAPVVHIPSIKRWGVQQHHLVERLAELGIDTLIKSDMVASGENFVLHGWYYYTDLDGWSKLLPDLILKSSLYRPNIFMCFGYAVKAWVECAQRYGVNSLLVCTGTMPQGKHGFNIFPYGDDKGIKGFMLFEPNDGFEFEVDVEAACQAFEIGECSYIPEAVLMASRSK